MVYNRRSRFAAKSFRLMRNNPDGTNPSITNMLGFSGTANLSGVLTTNAANLTVKIDNGTAETKSVDFTAAVSKTAVTIAEAVTALNTASFTSLTFSSGTDKDGNARLKCVSAAGTYVQVTGELAAALGFGQGIEFGGNGLEMFHFTDGDGLVSITMPKDTVDKQQIDVESSTGTVRRMNIGAKLLGVSPVISVYKDDYGVLEAIEGGTWDRTADTYTPPLATETTHPSLMMEVYAPLVNKDNANLGDEDSYELTTLHNCQGMEGDEDFANKDWKTVTYNITASEYTDSTGVAHPAYDKKRISKTAYQALDIANV